MLEQLLAVDDLIQLCRHFHGDGYPTKANSFFQFAILQREFARGIFEVEGPKFPTIVFRESQSLFMVSASEFSDDAIVGLAFPGGAHSVGPDNIRDLVIGLVLDEWQLAGWAGLDLSYEDSAPRELSLIWQGMSISNTNASSWAGISDSRLWFEMKNQGIFSLGEYPRGAN